MVHVLFDDGTDLYDARARVLESLATVTRRLPTGVTPELGPDATGVGWVYIYALSDFSPRARVMRERLDTLEGPGPWGPVALGPAVRRQPRRVGRSPHHRLRS